MNKDLVLKSIEEVCAYFEEDESRFSFDREEENCRYFMKDGRRCAIGMMVSVEEAKRLETHFPSTSISEAWDDIEGAEGFEETKELVRKHGLEDLCRLQSWHDDLAMYP